MGLQPVLLVVLLCQLYASSYAAPSPINVDNTTVWQLSTGTYALPDGMPGMPRVVLQVPELNISGVAVDRTSWDTEYLLNGISADQGEVASSLRHVHHLTVQSHV